MLQFVPIASWEAATTVGNRTLLSYIRMDSFFKYRVFAVETDSSVQTLDDLFHDHGHEVVAENATSYLQAVALANANAEAWRKKMVEVKACPCEPLNI